jgi:predicted amidohydrolase
MTCYDLRFPEVARTLADAGADVILTAAEWVRGPLKERRTLLHARAIENTLYVAGADHPPPLGVGISVVVDPQGVEIAGVGVTTDVAVGFVDRASIERVRRRQPRLALRRFRVVPRSALPDDPPSSPGMSGEGGGAGGIGDDLHALAGRESHELV